MRCDHPVVKATHLFAGVKDNSLDEGSAHCLAESAHRLEPVIVQRGAGLHIDCDDPSIMTFQDEIDLLTPKRPEMINRRRVGMKC